MRAAPFAYLAPATLREAISLLAERGDDAKVLAGGQSLIPLLNLRLARVGCLVDINGLAELRGVRREGRELVLGALTRHQQVATAAEVRAACPLLSDAAALIGNIRVRHRGTIGGSLAHADPAAEMGAVAVALDARIEVDGPAGARSIPAAEFFTGYLSTALQPGEIVTAVRFPVAPPGAGSSFVELARRAGDFAVVGVAAQVTFGARDGACEDVRLGVIGVGGTPVRARRAEAALRGRPPGAAAFAEAGAMAAEEVDPPDDVHASASYRRHLTRVLVRRALEAAARACGEGSAWSA